MSISPYRSIYGALLKEPDDRCRYRTQHRRMLIYSPMFFWHLQGGQGLAIYVFIILGQVLLHLRTHFLMCWFAPPIFVSFLPLLVLSSFTQHMP